MPARMFFERVVDEKGPMEVAITEAILEVAYLTMCIDTHLDKREMKAFAHAAGVLLGGDAAKDKAYAVLEEIKTNNAGLHTKSVKKGGFVGFGCNGKSIELADVLGSGDHRPEREARPPAVIGDQRGQLGVEVLLRYLKLGSRGLVGRLRGSLAGREHGQRRNGQRQNEPPAT